MKPYDTCSLHGLAIYVPYSGRHWQDKTLANSVRLLVEKNGLIMANRYQRFRKFGGENFGDLPTIRQCFMLYGNSLKIPGCVGKVSYMKVSYLSKLIIGFFANSPVIHDYMEHYVINLYSAFVQSIQIIGCSLLYTSLTIISVLEITVGHFLTNFNIWLTKINFGQSQNPFWSVK